MQLWVYLGVCILLLSGAMVVGSYLDEGSQLDDFFDPGMDELHAAAFRAVARRSSGISPNGSTVIAVHGIVLRSPLNSPSGDVSLLLAAGEDGTLSLNHHGSGIPLEEYVGRRVTLFGALEVGAHGVELSVLAVSVDSVVQPQLTPSR